MALTDEMEQSIKDDRADVLKQVIKKERKQAWGKIIGIVTGSDLEPYLTEDKKSEIDDKKTYITMAISKLDGSSMPERNCDNLEMFADREKADKYLKNILKKTEADENGVSGFFRNILFAK